MKLVVHGHGGHDVQLGGLALCQASELPADAEGLLKVLDLGIMSGAAWEATRRWREVDAMIQCTQVQRPLQAQGPEDVERRPRAEFPAQARPKNARFALQLDDRRAALAARGRGERGLPRPTSGPRRRRRSAVFQG